jgi:hypothetical protein
MAPNLSEILTSTLRTRSGKLREQISIHDPILWRLKEKGRQRKFSGGRSIVEELEYAENGTFLRYSGYEPLNIQPSEIMSAAEFGIKQAAIAVTISGLEELQNSGQAQIIDLMEARINNAERTFKNRLIGDVFSDGTADGGKQMGGLQHLISDLGTGTVGGINANDWDFWKNQRLSIASLGNGAASATTITAAMTRLYLKMVLNSDKCDLIIADNTYYEFYLSSLQAIQRIQNDKMASAGFQNLKFMGSDVVLGNGMNGPAPANKMYFLNTDYVDYRPHRNRDVETIGGDRQAINQDATTRIMAWAGNMTMSNRRLQGVLVA